LWESTALSDASTSSLTIVPAAGPVRGSIRPPGSKSITNRALVCAGLARGTSRLTGALASEDTQVMIECLRRLGMQIECQDESQTLVVHGCGGKIPVQQAELFVGNSGTTIRFLTALCALGRGTYRLDGIERMRQRPIGDLLDALNQLGADCRGELRNGSPPVIVRASGLRGGAAQVGGSISSQFLSGLLMAAPYAQTDTQIHVVGELVSKPYVLMTHDVVRAFGGTFDVAEYRSFQIPGNQTYRAADYSIEPDASAASYFWAAAAITGGRVTVEGLDDRSAQGDFRFVDCLRQMGCLVESNAAGTTVSRRAERGIDVDMNAISDTVQTLGAVALFAEGPTIIRGVAHIRHKETDRIGDLARELRKFGATVTESADGMEIVPPADIRTRRDIPIETYNDHRMAMSLALPGLVLPGITVLNPGCTAKTYPGFFADLERLVRGGST
jgi:3-phosphoshikimate 1-carboxyvinyltransferase